MVNGGHELEPSQRSGPIVVCLEPGLDWELLVQHSIAYARLLKKGLFLIAVLELPPQRSLTLSDWEEHSAGVLLDHAAELARRNGLATEEEIWLTRRWNEALEQIVAELSATAVVIGWRSPGRFRLFNPGRRLPRHVKCPVIMVSQPKGHKDETAWPPRWLVEAELQLQD